MCIKLLRAKYKVRALCHSFAGKSSPVWKRIEGIKNLISKDACLLVGNGNNIRTREDPWVLDFPSFKPNSKEGVDTEQALSVSQTISNNRYSWDTQKLNDLFDEQSVSEIQKIPLTPTATRDEWVWTISPLGAISVKTAYWLN